MITSKRSSFIFLVLILALLTTTEQSIPTIVTDNSLLNAQANYIISYFSLQKLTTSSYFQIDFSQSDIGVNDGSLNVTVNLNGSPMNTTNLTSSCISKVCIIRLGTNVSANTNVQTTLGLLKNPKFTASQKVTVFVYFAANSNQTQTVTLSSSIYTPMPVIINSVAQSDYGVGSNNVTYTFNVSFTYIPPNPEITIEIPSEVGYTNIETNLTFYGGYQNITPFLTSNMIILSVISAQITNPSGFMLLTLYGFQNPYFIGNSSSFNISMVQKKTSSSNNCVTCKVAFLYLNSSKLLIVSSTTPGDITLNMFSPSSYLVSRNISLTIGIKIVAPIPVGGKFRIILPSSITPSLPIACDAVYGFTLVSPAYCIYNATSNTIQTVGFSIPYLVSTGDAIINIYVINPKDSRPTYFNFESLDDQNRKIGKSRTPFLYNAAPLTLNANIFKNSTSIESSFTLNSNITLTQPMNTSSDLILVTLPPSNYYNLSAIECLVSSNIVSCTKSFDTSTNNLLITFSPPCSPICNASTIIFFTINNLINPSFINDDMQSIQIQTLSTFGVMESFDGSINLLEKQLSITELNWSGNQIVGSQYQLRLEFQIPRYIQSFGGYLLINFDQNSTYLNIIMNGTTYTYPQSVNVMNENNQSLSNTLTFYNTSSIWSLQQIKIKLCTSDSPCGSNLNITVLRKSYIPLQSAMMAIKAQTLNGEPIATSTNDVSSFMPQILTSNLSVISSLSVANTISNYVMKFQMNKLPFDSGLRIDLSSRHQIQSSGKCFVQLSPSTFLGYGIDCNVLNSSSVVLTYVGDIALMTAFLIDYKLTIVNVLNPPLIMPITYKIEPSFSSIKVGIFSILYAISFPYTLGANQLILSNTTYGQVANLTMQLKSGYFSFDEMRIYVPKVNFQAFYSLLSGVSLTSSIYNMTENETYFILQQIYSLDSTFILKLSNALNTSAISNITVQMYVQGYLSSAGIFPLPNITPVYLYGTASSSDRYVGENTYLLFDIRRVNAFSRQQTIKIFFNNTVFTISTANHLFTADPNNAQLYSYSETLNTWINSSKLLNLTTFQNMKFVPNSQTLSTLPKLNVSTFDQSNSIVATTLIDLTNIVPNKIKDSISYTFTRTSADSQNSTDIVLSFVPRYQDMATLMKIDLPLNQNKFTNVSSCVIGDSTSIILCQIVSLQSLSMTIQYPVNQTKITLKNVMNQFPSSNNLTIILMTQLFELIEQSSAPITPIINLDPLIITGISNTSIVSSPTQLILTITSPQNIIDSGSSIKLTLPDKIYSRVSTYALPDCKYQVSGNNYTGCNYTVDQLNDGKDWIQYVTVNFASIQILPNTTFQLVLYLINPWTSYKFSTMNISAILYNSLGQASSKGVISLSSIYSNLTSFNPAQISAYILQQTSKQCSQSNTLTFNVTLPVNLATQTYLYFIIPTAYYVLVNQTGYQIQSENASFYTVKRLISECISTFTSSGLCMKAGDILSSTIIVANQPYLMILDPKPIISLYFCNDNNLVTSNSNLNLNDRTPNSISSTILQRNIGNVSQSAINTLQFTLPTTFNISNPLKVSVLSTNSTIGFMNLIQNFKFISPNTTTTTSQLANMSYASTVNGRQLILSATYSPTYDVYIQINGVNPSYAPNADTQTYTVKIFDDNFVYFVTNSTLTDDSRLKPLTDGLTLVRSNALVNNLANYKVSGTLSNSLSNARLVFNQTTSISVPSSINFNNFTIGQFLNPLSSNWDTYESLSILNGTHILYANNKIKTTPSLTSLDLPTNTVASIQYSSDMQVNTEQTVTVNFGSSLVNVSRINIKIPTFFKSISECRINSSILVPCNSSQLSPALTMIIIPISSTVSKVSFTVVTQDYQTIIANQTIIIETQYPTESYQQAFGLNLWGTSLNTSLTMTSYKVNDPNDITLKITPLSRNNSQIVVYFPTYLNQQIQTLQTDSTTPSTIKLMQGTIQQSMNLQFNSSLNTYFFTFSLGQSLSTQNLSLTLINLLNPASNQPFYFVIQQQDPNNNIFGHSTVKVEMNILEQIYIRSVQRNTSKIGVNVEIITQIQLPLNLSQLVLENLSQSSCIIEMPSIQVTRNPSTSSCEILLIGDNVNTSLPCQMHSNITNAIITSCNPGLNQYVIKTGFKNMLYSIIPNETNKPYVFIGSQYQMAESNIFTTQFLTPIMTSGNLNLNSLVSTSLVRLQKTVLNLNITLENLQQVDCINFIFEIQNYLYSTNDLKCTSNGQSTECWSNEIGSIMINISSIRSQSQQIQIEGLYNYLRQQNFTIKTLKYLSNSSQSARLLSESNLQNVKSAPSTSFGLIDIFYSSPSDLGAPFASNSYNVRVILPDNYVSQEQQQIKVFFDDESLIPSSLSKTLLQFNITSNIPACKLVNAQFATSFTLNCMFNQSMNFNLMIDMFDKSHLDTKLAQNLFTTFIYPSLSSSCKNQMCDKCSTGSDGTQKCFSCRQNYYEYQNSCVQSCPNGFTQYDVSMSCEKCSAYCSTCYGLFWNNCLQCQNTTLVSDNGQCSEQCSSGYAENGYCVGDKECYDSGCRLCGTNGFCYQCLPDYTGAPACEWEQLLPSLFMSFFIAPFLIYAIASTIYFFATKGALTMTNQVIFAFSLLQFTVWLFIVPALHTKEQAMVLLSLIILRIVIGIVAYETFYKKQINSHIGVNQEESLLEQQKSSQKDSKHEKYSSKELQEESRFEEDWKTRLIRFLAHTNGIDTYEEFKVLFMQKIRIEHNNLYLWLLTGNRLLVCILMFYILSKIKAGDLTIMPVVAIVSSLLILSLRLVKSEKFQKVWEKIRNPTK